MKGITTITRRALLAAATLALATTSHAAVVTWGAATNISGDSDVSTAGTLFGAFNVNGITTPVNGVTFQNFLAPVGANSSTTGAFTLSSPAFTNNIVFGMGGVSPAYANLLGSLVGAASATLNINGLVAGQTYQFEWWSNLSANTALGFPTTTATAGNAVSLGSNPSGQLGGLGQFAIGTFIADASNTQSIAFSSASTVVLNGFQLRAVPAVAAVPEPGSALAGLLALGACASGLVRRNRQTERATAAV